LEDGNKLVKVETNLPVYLRKTAQDDDLLVGRHDGRSGSNMLERGRPNRV